MNCDDNEERRLRGVALQNPRAQEREGDLIQTKESLPLTSELLNNILASITDGFVSFDLDWRIIYLNRRAAEILHPLYPSKESLMGKVHWEAFPETVGTPLEEHYRRVLRDQVSVQFEHFYQPLNSWFDIRAYPSPSGVSIYFLDVTERKRNEAALRQQHEWFAVTLASIGDAVITTDTAGKVTYLNPVAEMMTGWKLNEAAGQPLDCVFRIINERTRLPAVNPISKVLRDGKAVELANHTAVVTRDGREIAIEDSAAPIRDMRGEIAGAVMVFHDVTERRHAEESMRESEKRFSALVLAAAQIVWVADASGGFVEDSPSWREFTGQTVEEMKGWGRLKIIHSQDHEPLKAAWQRAIAGRCTLTTEYQLRHHSGAWRWVSVRAVPMLAEDGSIRSWVGMHTDITERRLAENSLRESENRKSAILSASLDAIITMDHLGKISDFNSAAERMFGYSNGAVQGRDLAKLLIPERLRERHRQGMKHYLATGEGPVLGRRIEMPALRTDGSEFPIELSISRIPNVEPPMFTATLRDITDRKLTEEARSRLAAVVESSDDAIISKTLEGIITSWNNGARSMYGYEPKEVLGKHITILIPPHLQDEEPKIIERLRRGEKVEHYETVRVRKNGSLVDVSLSVSPIKDASGAIIGASKIARDISDRKRIDQERRRKEDELRALANSMPQLAWMAEPDGNIFWYNQRWYEYTGTTPEQMQGWGWQTVHDPEILPQVLVRWKESLATGQSFEMEFPLRGADGVFRWFLTRVNPVRDHEGRILRWFGTNTDVDTVRRAQEALREEGLILELLNDTGAAIASELNLQTLVQTVTDSATKLCGAKFGAFFYNVINEQGESFLLYTLSGAPREAFEKFGMPRNTPVFDTTFSGRGVMRSSDILQDPLYGKVPPHHGMPKGHLPVRSYLAVPVTSRSGEVIGGLFFGHPEPNIFSAKSERLVVGIAAQAAIAIDNARLYDAAQREIAERKRAEGELAGRVKLASLRAEIGAAIALNEDWDAILQRCADSLVKHLEAAFARVWILNPHDSVLELRASAGMYTHLNGPHGRIKVGEFKIGRIAQSRQPHLTNDVQHDSNISDPVWAQREGMVAFAGYPLVVEEHVVGVIALFAGHALREEILKELSLIADGLAQWIQRRRAEEALRESERKLAAVNADLDKKVQERTASLLEALSQLEEFSYSVSHDLRAPLRAISGYNRIVLADYGATLPPDALQYLDKISRSTERMERLVNDVLTMSRVTRSAIHLHPVALLSFIEEIIEQHPSMQHPEAIVTLDTPHTVSADDASLGQALLNLLSNAVKFLPAGEKATVQVRSERIGDRVRIWIEDQGIGIPPQHREKLFGMFQRLPTERRYEGTGIGLAIVRKAVERMGGKVGMESNEPRGSRFWIELQEAQ